MAFRRKSKRFGYIRIRRPSPESCFKSDEISEKKRNSKSRKKVWSKAEENTPRSTISLEEERRRRMENNSREYQSGEKHSNIENLSGEDKLIIPIIPTLWLDNIHGINHPSSGSEQQPFKTLSYAKIICNDRRLYQVIFRQSITRTILSTLVPVSELEDFNFYNLCAIGCCTNPSVEDEKVCAEHIEATEGEVHLTKEEKEDYIIYNHFRTSILPYISNELAAEEYKERKELERLLGKYGIPKNKKSELVIPKNKRYLDL